METALWTFAPLAASGAAYLAYKHPNSFRSVGRPVAFVLWLASLATWVWSIGVRSANKSLIARLDLDPEQVNAVTAPTLNVVNNWGTGMGAVALYLIVLVMMPHFIDLDEPERRF